MDAVINKEEIIKTIVVTNIVDAESILFLLIFVFVVFIIVLAIIIFFVVLNNFLETLVASFVLLLLNANSVSLLTLT